MPKNRCPLVAASTLLVALTSNALAQDAVQWRVEDGGNGHWYATFATTGNESETLSQVESMGASLASIASAEEDDFAFNVAYEKTGAVQVLIGAREKSTNNFFWLTA